MARSTKVRKGMPSVQLTKAEFADRFRSRFYDPAFDAVAGHSHIPACPAVNAGFR